MLARHAFACLRGAALACLLWAPAARAEGAATDAELSRAVAGYVITLDQAERVAHCMDELGSWAQKNPAEVRRINRKLGASAPLSRTLQVMEAEPALQERIQRHGTSARDLLLLPLALFAAQGWTEGPMAGEASQAVHPANVRFVAEHREAMAHLFARYEQNQKALAVR
ncbi:MAG: hypothetical protein HZB56_04785 [Deltaproteobacteria bacterium]|nr:hypothetical protein [Deltaproteobacteria bacterium]